MNKRFVWLRDWVNYVETADYGSREDFEIIKGHTQTFTCQIEEVWEKVQKTRS